MVVKKTAMYNIKSEDKPKYCNLHKTDDMIDKIHKLCEKEDCKTLTSYNFNSETQPKFCKIHKIELMVNITNFKKCKEIKCNVRQMHYKS